MARKRVADELDDDAVTTPDDTEPEPPHNPPAEDSGPETQEVPVQTDMLEGQIYHVGPVPPELMYLYPDTP